MLNGNWYGLIITLLTLLIAVILTIRNVGDTGIRFEVVIQPVPVARGEEGQERQIQDPKGEKQSKESYVKQYTQSLRDLSDQNLKN